MKAFQYYSQDELIYIAKFYERDGVKSIACAIGRTKGSVQQQYHIMTKRNLLQYYRSLWDAEDVNALERR